MRVELMSHKDCRDAAEAWEPGYQQRTSVCTPETSGGSAEIVLQKHHEPAVARATGTIDTSGDWKPRRFVGPRSRVVFNLCCRDRLGGRGHWRGTLPPAEAEGTPRWPSSKIGRASQTTLRRRTDRQQTGGSLIKRSYFRSGALSPSPGTM